MVEKKLYSKTGGTLVAVLKWVIHREAEAKLRRLLGDVRTFIERTIAWTSEGGLEHSVVQQRILCRLICNAKHLGVQIENMALR